jgi:hypothetical protein
VFTQILALDAAASLGIVLSDAATSHWVSPYTAVKVANVSSTNNASATGSARPTNGLIVRFDL